MNNLTLNHLSKRNTMGVHMFAKYGDDDIPVQ